MADNCSTIVFHCQAPSLVVESTFTVIREDYIVHANDKYGKKIWYIINYQDQCIIDRTGVRAKVGITDEGIQS